MFITHIRARVLGALLLICATSGAHAQLSIPGLDPLEPDDVRVHSMFGYAVGIMGNTAVVGAPQVDGHGAAYVFTRNGSTWKRTAKLIAADVAPGTFGSVIAYDGTLLVGDQERSQVYYFTFDGRNWKPRAILKGGATGFGRAIAMQGCTALITSSGSMGLADQPGFVHIFDRCSTSDGNWKFIKSFNAPGTRPDEWFGSSIALSGTQLLVGAPTEGHAGSVYYFVNQSGNWVLKQKIVPTSVQPNDFHVQFGDAVAFHDTLAVIGEPAARTNIDPGSGGVAVTFGLTSKGWVQLAEMQPAESTGWAGYGARIIVLADRAIISAPFGLGSQFEFGGTLYIYRRSGTTLTFESSFNGGSGSGIASANGIGIDFAVSGSSWVIGAPFGGGGRDPGAADVFSFPPP